MKKGKTKIGFYLSLVDSGPKHSIKISKEFEKGGSYIGTPKTFKNYSNLQSNKTLKSIIEKNKKSKVNIKYKISINFKINNLSSANLKLSNYSNIQG